MANRYILFIFLEISQYSLILSKILGLLLFIVNLINGVISLYPFSHLFERLMDKRLNDTF